MPTAKLGRSGIKIVTVYPDFMRNVTQASLLREGDRGSGGRSPLEGGSTAAAVDEWQGLFVKINNAHLCAIHKIIIELYFGDIFSTEKQSRLSIFQAIFI